MRFVMAWVLLQAGPADDPLARIAEALASARALEIRFPGRVVWEGSAPMVATWDGRMVVQGTHKANLSTSLDLKISEKVTVNRVGSLICDGRRMRVTTGHPDLPSCETPAPAGRGFVPMAVRTGMRLGWTSLFPFEAGKAPGPEPLKAVDLDDAFEVSGVRQEDVEGKRVISYRLVRKETPLLPRVEYAAKLWCDPKTLFPVRRLLTLVPQAEPESPRATLTETYEIRKLEGGVPEETFRIPSGDK